MVTKICKECGRELPLDNFRLTRWGDKANVCNDCCTSKRKEKQRLIEQEKEKERNPEPNPALSNFTPRELILELRARGYKGELYYTEIKKVII